jgi:hypothetical protein
MVFCVVTTCSLEKGHYFGGTYYLHLHAHSTYCLLLISFLLGLLSDPEDGGDTFL